MKQKRGKAVFALFYFVLFKVLLACLKFYFKKDILAESIN